MLHDWVLVYHMGVNTSYNYFIPYLEDLLHLHAPTEIEVIRPMKKNALPWIPNALIKSSRKCRNLYIKLNNSLECKNEYIQYKYALIN